MLWSLSWSEKDIFSLTVTEWKELREMSAMNKQCKKLEKWKPVFKYEIKTFLWILAPEKKKVYFNQFLDRRDQRQVNWRQMRGRNCRPRQGNSFIWLPWPMCNAAFREGLKKRCFPGSGVAEKVEKILHIYTFQTIWKLKKQNKTKQKCGNMTSNLV